LYGRGSPLPRSQPTNEPFPRHIIKLEFQNCLLYMYVYMWESSNAPAEKSPHRKPTRLACHDYSSSGPYFVTISTHLQRCVLSTVHHSAEVLLTPSGQAVRQTWLSMPTRFPQLILDEFVIMPNHFHAILAFHLSFMGQRSNFPSAEERLIPHAHTPFSLASFEPSRPIRASSSGSSSVRQLKCSLPAVIGAFKSLSTIAVNKLLGTAGTPLWHRSFHDHIIRNTNDMKNAQRYIQENPLRWPLTNSNDH
jgi:putative transposase